MTELLDQTCFFIAPIGEDGSPERERSDGVRDFIIKPAAHDVGLCRTIRADEIARPGQITLQVIEHVLGAKGAVVDLTGANPNVYYEMAIRHTAHLPTVLISSEEERDKLPFDVQGMRTIFFEHTSLKSADACRSELVAHLGEALNGAVDSPVVASVNLKNLESGDAQDQTLASLVNTVDGLAREVKGIRNGGATWPVSPTGQSLTSLPQVVEDLEQAYGSLRDLAQGQDDPELEEILKRIRRPYRYLLRRTPGSPSTDERRRVAGATAVAQGTPDTEKAVDDESSSARAESD